MSTTREIDSLAGLGLRFVQGWKRFWFSPGDPTMLGVIRICCGLMVLYVHLAYSYDLQTFFGREAWLDLEKVNESRKEIPYVGPPTTWEPLEDLPAQNAQEQEFKDRWGIVPKQVLAYGQPLWSIWYHVTDPAWMWVVHVCILVIMFLFTIGLCTRVTSVLTWLAILSYIQRAYTSLFGMDTIMIVVVLYLMIGPSGAALSVDRLIARYWATYQALRNHRPAPELSRPEPLVSANLALRLLQVHVCIIYLASGTSKLLGPAWWGGSAVWLTMVNYEFSPMQLQIYTAFLKFLTQHRWLCELFVTGGTYFTLAFEIGFAFLVWNRQWRWLMIVSAVMLHLGIAFFMGLVAFSLMMLTADLAFISPVAVRQLLWRLGRGPDGVRFAVVQG